MSRPADKLLPKPRMNWAAVFAAYCNGTPEDELAIIFNADDAAIRTKIRDEGWAALRARMPIAVAAPTSLHEVPLHERGKQGCPAITSDSVGIEKQTQAKLRLIEQNREANYRIAAELREDLLGLVKSLRAGTLKLEKQWHTPKGVVTRANVDPTIVDRVALAKYAQTIADISYRATGDLSQNGTPRELPPGVPSSHSQITIVLPGVIAKPRAERTIAVSAEPAEAKHEEVIDLTPLDEAVPEVAAKPTQGL